MLKELIGYFREIQTSYETRAKATSKLGSVMSGFHSPALPSFLQDGGICEANHILAEFHEQAVQDCTKVKEISNDVIAQLTGLRVDLAYKIKEIKALAGDFKNTVEKEKEGSRRAIASFQDALQLVESDEKSVSGRDDPFIVKLGVERQIGKHIEEENYLHRVCGLINQWQ